MTTTILDAAAAAHSTSLASRQSAAITGELIRHLLMRESEVAPSLLGQLEEGVHTYEVDFRAYLNGQGQRPPIELGGTLAAAFVEIAAAAGGKSQFQVEALEARFHAAERLLTQRLERKDHGSPMRAGQRVGATR